MKAILAILFMCCNSAMAQTHQVSLSWEPVTPPAGKTITGYNIYRSTTSNGQAIGTHLNTAVNPHTNYLDPKTNVVDGATYYYRVTAWCISCNPQESGFSSEVRVVIPAATPTSGVRSTIKSAFNQRCEAR